LLESFPPSRIVATHAAAACVNWDGPAELLARRMSGECGLPAEATIGYPTPGSLGSLMGIDRDVPMITLELASKSSIAGSREEVRRALLTALEYPDRGRTGLTAAAE
jgi:protein MpaA